MFYCGLRCNVKVRNDSYSRSRWFGKKEISKSGISFFLPLSLSLFSCMLKSHSLVKFSALFSGPDGRFLLVGCDSYITPLMTRTSSCFLQPRLKVNLSGGGALQHPVPLHPVRLGDAHTQSLSLSFAPSLALSLCLSLFQSQQRIEGETDAQELFSSSIFFLFCSFRRRRWLYSSSPSSSEKLLHPQHPAIRRALRCIFCLFCVLLP